MPHQVYVDGKFAGAIEDNTIIAREMKVWELLIKRFSPEGTRKGNFGSFLVEFECDEEGMGYMCSLKSYHSMQENEKAPKQIEHLIVEMKRVEV